MEENQMKKILVLVLFLCAAFTLTACGGGKGIEGEWEFESMTMGDETYKVGDETPVGTLESDYVVFTFEKDGTGKAVMTAGDESEETPLTWAEDGDAWKVTIDEEDAKAEIIDDKLVITVDSMSYTLVRK
jgi:major membrane immunogen (membrane-anchored lipoprotein)